EQQTTSIQRDTAEREPPPRQLPRGPEKLGSHAGRIRELLLHRGPARHHGAAGPEGVAPEGAGGSGALPRLGHRPGEVRRLPPEQRLGARGAGVAPELRRAVRGALQDDAVQGQGAEGRGGVGERRALRLPGPDGRRHPAVQRAPRPRRGGSAPAPGARADAREALQRAVRRGLRGAGAHDPPDRRARNVARRSDEQDEQKLAVGGFLRRDPRRARRRAAQDPPRQDRLGLRGDREPGEARHHQPPGHLRRDHRQDRRDAGGRVRGEGIRRPQKRPRRGRRRGARARQGGGARPARLAEGAGRAARGGRREGAGGGLPGARRGPHEDGAGL
ncbi:MAG: Tryptophanyl-tRNA synthetase, partial [uncultured Rubrobacteraceae bacterium]